MSLNLEHLKMHQREALERAQGWIRLPNRRALTGFCSTSPVAPNIKLAAAKGIKSPAGSGPIIPETSICNPARVYAEPNSSAETISAITEEWAGEPNAKLAPKKIGQFWPSR